MWDRWRYVFHRVLFGAFGAVVLSASCALVLIVWFPGAAQPVSPKYPGPDRAPENPVVQSDLQVILEREVALLPGTWGIAVRHLKTGETVAINADRVFQAASLYKLMVMSQAFVDAANGDLDWSKPLTFTEEDRAVDPANMEYRVGVVLRAIDAVYEMILDSRNAAAVMLLRQIGTDRVNTLAESYGLHHTRIGRPSTTTPAEILSLLQRIESGRVVDQAASEEMISILKRQVRNDRIPRSLPAGTEVAHKTGELPGVRHDVGIVYAPSGPYIVVLMVEEAPDIDAASEHEARLSRTIYDYFESR